jgi:hypothetical protein
MLRRANAQSQEGSIYKSRHRLIAQSTKLSLKAFDIHKPLISVPPGPEGDHTTCTAPRISREIDVRSELRLVVKSTLLVS